ncbi:MAG: hypothetical protein ACR2H2_18920 [Solirubrobacteraceae bacterium]
MRIAVTIRLTITMCSLYPAGTARMCISAFCAGVTGGAVGRGELEELLRPPAGERALDLGAGNGLGGEELRRVGVGRVFAVDLELQARQAVCRNRRGVYDDYRAGDLADLPEAKLAALAALEPTAVLALSWVIDQPMLVSSVLVDARPH